MDVFDILGQQVITQHFSKPQLQEVYNMDVSSLPVGNYFVKMITDKGSEVKKIVIE